MRHKILFAWW